MTELVKGGIYQHYKGKNYRLIDIVTHSETLEELVLYECLYDNEVNNMWVRPLNLFTSSIETEEGLKPRFSYIGNQKGRSRI